MRSLRINIFKRKLVQKADREKAKDGKKEHVTKKKKTPVTKKTSIAKAKKTNKKVGLTTTTTAKPQLPS